MPRAPPRVTLTQNEWVQFSDQLGLDDGARTVLYNHAQINGPRSLHTIRLVQWEHFWKGACKHAQNEGVSLGWTAEQNLHALVLYMEYCKAANLNYGHDDELDELEVRDVFLIVMAKWRARIADLLVWKEERVDKLDMEPLKSLHNEKNWLAWKDTLHTQLSRKRNDNLGHPLTYLIRTKYAADDEDTEADYESLDDEICAIVDLRGPEYKADNEWLWKQLETLVRKGDCWTYIQRFRQKKDG